MSELSGLQIFKYLPAAKKLPEGNCKKCSFPTCMAFALNLAKGQTEIELCPYAPDKLKEILAQSMKKPQKEVYLGAGKYKVLIGGENVLFRHDKTFVNKTAIAMVIDLSESDWEEKLKRVTNFEITRINETFKVDLIYLKGTITTYLTNRLDEQSFAWVTENDLSEIIKVEDEGVFKTIKKLTEIRKKAVLEKDENYSNPVMIYFQHPVCHAEFISGSIQCANASKILKQVQDDVGGDCFDLELLKLISKAAFYLCKYANLLVFEDFNEALMSTLMTLRQNIYTDPQKPLQVESKVYEFNNPDENSLIFLTTNFALTYFAVANEIEALNKPAYLVVTPSEGMSVLTAWSAEKFTAGIVAKTVKQYGLAEKIKNKEIIIPGLLSHMKNEIEEVLPGFKVLVGPNEAYLLGDFVKSISN
ncbi:MAG: (Fe-S)-binding protein [Candidatus Gastranaerophilales bacterium]|nr:(Fe-S)-binding protein [Candidatus Gastranaerophilales bacterium]